MGWASQNGIELDHRGEVAIGVQLDWSIRAAVASGRLQPGDRLPALRDLAAELGVNHNTVRAAVAKLEADGLLESRHGRGTFVAEDAAEREGHGSLVEHVTRWAVDAGVSPRELAAALYVTGEAPAERDSQAAERRALRDEIAMLERLIAQLETKLPKRLPPDDADQPPGARLLSVAELTEQRDGLVRRLAAVQRQLDGDDDSEPAAQPETAPRRAPAKNGLKAPRPGPSPA
jgi:DNA-binding transcriptional regulator YhcF (GntR family)